MRRTRRFGRAGLAGLLVVTTSGCIKLLTPNATGTDSANGGVYGAEVSPDGTKLLFVSDAGDMGPTDSNGVADVYLKDLVGGTLTLISANATGTGSGNGESVGAAFSPDGTKIAFTSEADDVGPDDPGHNPDLYVHDLATGTTEVASVDAATGQASDAVWEQPTFEPEFSPDGSEVAFTSVAASHGPTDSDRSGSGGFFDDHDVYVRDLAAGTTTLVSANATGTDSGNDGSRRPQFSPDGTKVLFESIATNLGPADYPRGGGQTGEVDLYVRDLASRRTSLVSVNSWGTASGNGASDTAAFGPDGTVAFMSSATDLGPPASWCVSRYVVYPCRNIYRRDLRTGVTTLVSVNATGYGAGNSSSYFPKFSRDGTKILFYSYARDLLATGDPGNAGLYVRDLMAGRTSLVSLRTDGTAANLTYGTGTFDPTGTKVAYTSLDTQHGLPDDNYGGDVVVFDMTTGRTSLVSVNTTRTATGNDGSGGEMFALGGQQVVFRSEATDLVAKDTNGTDDLFIGAPLPPPAGQP